MKHVLITGGASGLGKQICHHLKAQGYALHVWDKLPLQNVPEDLSGILSSYTTLDLSDPVLVYKAIHNFESGHDVIPDVLILNAAPRVFKQFTEFSLDELISLSNASFICQLAMLKHFLPVMTQKGGKVITISSKSAIQGFQGGAIYSTYKAAWLVFNEALSRELRQQGNRVTITTLCPDSFSDLQGNWLKKSDRIIGGILKKIDRAIQGNSSAIRFVITFKTKVILTIQYMKKIAAIYS